MPTTSRLAVLLFTDMVGSTDLKSRLGATGYTSLLERHNAIFEGICADMKGEVLKHTGDGYFAAFTTASDAVRAALLFQYAMRAERWSVPLAARVGIHIGEVAVIEMAGRPDVVGVAADLAERVMGLASGGQILLTSSGFNDARQFVAAHPAVDSQPPPALKWIAHGPYLFTGIDERLEIFEVGADGVAPMSSPKGGEKARRVVPHDQEPTLGWRPAIGLPIPQRPGWMLEKRIGEGGFGEVWLGKHEKTRQRRAFKFCFDADRLRSFKRELTLFRLMREALGERTDIARLYEVKLDEPPFFLESEWTEGGNLVEWSDSRGGIATIPLEERLEIVAKISDAVAAAHSVGVLHKDIKPSNVLVQPNADGTIQPRLADFGISFLADRSQLAARHITETGFTVMTQTSGSSMTGTRLYSPPEVLAGKPFTTQGDIYALGVLLYQMAVGDLSRPLAEGWERELSDELIRQDIAACCDGDPVRRPASAGEIAQRIRALPERREAERQRSQVAVTLQWRHRVLRRSIAASIAMALLAVAVASSSAFYVRRVRTAQRAETTQRLRAEEAEQAAKVSEAAARADAKRAQRLAVYANARYLLGQGRVQAAMAQAVKAYELGGTWEDGYLLTQVVRQARQSWRPIGSVPATGSHRAFVTATSRPYLVLGQGDKVTSYVVPSGEVAGRATLDRAMRFLVPVIGPEGVAPDDTQAVLAATSDTLTRFEAPELRAGPTTRIAGIVSVATHVESPTLAIIDSSGLLHVLDARTLQERAKRQVSRDSRFPQILVISPSGKQIAYRGGWYLEELVTWNWESNQVSTRVRHAHSVAFADDGMLVGRFGVEGQPAALWAFDPLKEAIGRSIRLPESSALVVPRLSVWRETRLFEGTASPLPETHVMAALIASEGLDMVDFTDATHLLSTRYDSIWPFETKFTAPAADLKNGLLALECGGQTLLFERHESTGIFTDFRTVALLDHGLLAAFGLGEKAAVYYTPAGSSDAAFSVALGWTSGRPWGAWATPDRSTVAILRQEGVGPDAAHPLGAMGSDYRQKVLCIYDAAGFIGAEPKLTLKHEVELAEFRSEDGRVNRILALSPDTKVAVFGIAGGRTARYDIATGKMLTQHSLGPFSIVSPDGRFLAGQDADGVIVVDVATGRNVTSIRDIRGLQRLCFSADASELWVAQLRDEIDRFSVTDGKLLGHLRSELRPLAVSPTGERFVGYMNDGASKGSIMLGDTASGEPLLVLAPNASDFDSAAYHPEGRYLAIIRSRMGAEMIVSSTPAQARQALLRTADGKRPLRLVAPSEIPASTSPAGTRETTSATTQGPIRADDFARLRENIGNDVTVEGRVNSAAWSRSQKVMIIEFDGPADERFLAAMFSGDRMRFDARFGGDVAAALNGASIRISGTVKRYAGRAGRWDQPMQIVLTDPADLTVVAPAPPATAPATP